MTWFFNAIYLVILICGSPWMLWRYWIGKNRRGWTQKLLGWVKPEWPESPKQPSNLLTADSNPASETIWFHAVSVGEVNLLAPVLTEFRAAKPTTQIAISTTTETGYDLAKQKHPDCFVFFCPFDFSWAISNVLNRLKPIALVLVELEMWPNLISVTQNRGVPVAVINARLSAKSKRGYTRFKWLLGSVFQKLSLVLCQNKEYAERFEDLVIDSNKIQVTGNVKFDGVQTERGNPQTLGLVKLVGIEPSDKIFIAGSTQVEEDLMAAEVFQELAPDFPELRLILVPRHPDRVGSLVGQLNRMGLTTQLRSGLGSQASPTGESKTVDGANANLANQPNLASWPNWPNWPNWPKGSILIVDVIGELGGWWGRADMAYVGGSMGSRGGQNMIEPAGYGAPVSFGPNTVNFREIVGQLMDVHAAKVVQSTNELRNFVTWNLEQPNEAKAMGARAKNVVQCHLGASQRTVESLCTLIDNRDSGSNLTTAESSRPKAA